MRHFLDIKDFDKDRLTAMLDTARDMKSGAYTGTPLSGRHIGMIFEKPSTRHGFRLKWVSRNWAAFLLCWPPAICNWAGVRRWQIQLKFCHVT